MAGWLAARGLTPWPDGRAEVTSLIPQRPPLLLVDRLAGVRGGPRFALAASLAITGDEPVLRGHFPGRPVWPGSHTIEGLAQTCALAGALAARAGSDPVPGGSRPADGPRLALVVAVKVKLTGLVTPPARLDYFVELAHVVGDVSRFTVEASVGGDSVAAGSLDVLLRAPEGS